MDTQNENNDNKKSGFNWELTFWLVLAVIALIALEEGIIFCIRHGAVIK